MKKQFKMPAFFWLMNQTEYIREYLTAAELLKNDSSHVAGRLLVVVFLQLMILLGVM